MTASVTSLLNTNGGSLSTSYDSTYFNDKYITLEEPRVKLFTGKFNKNNEAGFEGVTYNMPNYYGAFNACYQTFGNDCTGSTPINNISNIISGLWVPPNKYVYLYNKYQGDLGAIKDANISKDLYGNPLEYSTKWIEGDDAKTYKKFCPNADKGEVPIKITNAKYICNDGSGRSKDVTNNRWIKNKLGLGSAAWVWPYGNDLNNYFDEDPCNNVVKSIEMKYNCGYNGIWNPPQKPEGVYPPGFYETLSSTSDPSILLPNDEDQYNTNINKMSSTNLDEKTIIVRPMNMANGEPKKWKDHLYDCCVGNIKNRTLCGSYRQADPKGVNNCSFLLNEKNKNQDGNLLRTYCNIDDIKDISNDGKKPPGKCNWICKSNPALCDEIKKEYCINNPNSSWCDCINAETRQEYKDLKFRLNQANLPVYINKCMINSCRNGDNDLSKNFILSSELNMECPTPEAIQQTIVSGSGNVLSNIDQTVSISKPVIQQGTGSPTISNPTTTLPITSPPTVTQPVIGQNTNNQETTTINLTSENKSMIYILLFFIILVFLSIILYFALKKKDEENEINDDETQFI
jgi:hypothetical protein